MLEKIQMGKGDTTKAIGKAADRKGMAPEEVVKLVAVIRYSSESSPLIACRINGVGVNLLVDTGSRASFIRKDVLQELLR